MKIIDFSTIKNLGIDPTVCYKWVSEMIAQKKTATLPPKISLHLTDGAFCNVMPCVLSGEPRMGGVKVVNRYPDRIPSLDSNLLLLNMDTGDFLAYMDANWITAMRTGAVAAHSIIHLAKSDFSVVSFLGLGNTARATLLVLASVLKERKLKVRLLKYKGQEALFAERFRDFENLEFTYVDTNEALVKGAEVVVSCVTYFADDICADDCFDEGVLVVPVHTRGFTNCDLFFDKVYADDYGHVHHFKNFDKFKYFAEVCDIVNGSAVGRENDHERILAYNIGLSIHDINFAGKIFWMLAESGALTNLPDVDMKAPEEKFWI